MRAKQQGCEISLIERKYKHHAEYVYFDKVGIIVETVHRPYISFATLFDIQKKNPKNQS